MSESAGTPRASSPSSVRDQDAADRDHQVAGDPGEGDDDVTAARIAVIARDDGDGLGPPEDEAPAKNVSRGRITVKNGSMCLTGFQVRRPSWKAVGSPCFIAAYP